MAQINYTATADLKAFSTWCTNNVDQNASTWDSTTQEGVLVLNSGVTSIGQNAFEGCTDLLTMTLPNEIRQIGFKSFQQCSNLTSITFGNNLTSISSNSFSGCTSLTSITLPNSLTTLPNQSSFGYCTSLTSITFGNNLQEISSNIFEGCTSLTSITFPNSLKTLKGSAFNDCTNLTTFTIPDSVNDFGNCFTNTAWWNSQNDGIIYKDNWCLGYKGSKPTGELTIQNNIKGIASNAFSVCTGLTSINLPTSLTIIGTGAFNGCTGLTEITIPENITRIGSHSFAGTNITQVYWNAVSSEVYGTTAPTYSPFASINSNFSITIGSSVVIIPNFLCNVVGNKLTSINFENATSLTTINEQAFKGCTGLTSINFENATSLTTINVNAFYGCTGLTSLVFNNSITTIKAGAFNGCTNLLSVTCLATTPPTLGSNNFTTSNDTLYVPSASVSAYQNNASWSAAFTSIEAMPPEIHYTATADLKSFSTWLTNNVDQNASTWDSTTQEGVLVLNSGVTTIGDNAFQSCRNLLTINIPEGITSIGHQAFASCSNISFAELPSTLTSLQDQAFWNNDKLHIIKCNAVTPPSIGLNLFGAFNDVLYVPVGSLSAYQNSGLSSKFDYLLEWAGNTVITYHSSADLSNYSSWITDNAISTTYDSTTQIGTIEVLPYEIGDSAFKNCTTLTQVEFTNILVLNSNAFSSCNNLTSVTLGSPLTTLGQNAFSGCTSLSTFTIPSSVTLLDRTSFQNTGWWNNQSDDVLYKDGWCLGYKTTKPTGVLTINADKIASNAFYGCTNITNAILGNSVTIICNQIFYGCTSLNTITLGNSVKSIGTHAFSNCPSLTTVYWNAENITTYKGYTNTFSSSPISTVVFGDSVQGIPYRAFQQCQNLTSITIPNSVTNIGQQAFWNCPLLTTVYWNAENVTTYPGYNNTFGNTVPINTVIFGDSVTTIPSSAFYSCTSLTEVTFGNSITTIGSNAFYGCTGLTSINLPSSLTSIGNSTFNGCTGLSSITLPNSLTTISVSAFYNCTSLTTVYWNAENISTYSGGYSSIFGSNTPISTVVFGDSVQSIPNSAFFGCTGLTSINLPSSLTNISNFAFQNCTNLLTVTCLVTTPPTLGSSNFTASNDTLKVLPSALSTYQNNTYWRNAFTTIEPLTVINYTATADLKAFSTWCTTNVNQSASTYDSTTQEGVLVLNSGVTTIGNGAFKDCSALLSINIPEGITIIGSQAFYNCTNLNNITLPNSLTKLVSGAFQNCTNLTNITLPNSLTSIDENAFRSCTGLSTFTIPSSVTKLYRSSFERTGWWNSQSSGVLYKDNWCLGYKTNKPTGDLTINADKIAGLAFDGCTGITSITLPSSLICVGQWVFNGCTSLTTVYWNAENITTYPTGGFGWVYGSSPISTVVFGNTVQSIPTDVFKNCTTLISVTLPASLTSIPNSAFYGCTGLSSITLPTSLTSIGTSAFQSCTNLLSVTCEATTPPTLGSSNFTASDDTLYVPSAAKSAYENNTNWRNAFTTIAGIYNLTTSVSGSGSISPSEGSLYEGESVTLTITPTEGNGIFSVTDNGTSVPVTRTGMTYTISNIAADHAIAVVFKPLFTITTSAGEGGSITPSMTVMQNEDATIVITPAAGYSVSHVYVDGVDHGSILNYTFQNVVANHTVTAEFVALYTVSTTTTEGGSISPSSSTVEAGSDVTLTITPDEGMLIFNVLDNDTPVPVLNPLGMTYTISNIQENHTVEAIFMVAQNYGFDLSEMIDTDFIIQTLDELEERK